jgi:lysophospholipase L1-like esterase
MDGTPSVGKKNRMSGRHHDERAGYAAVAEATAGTRKLIVACLGSSSTAARGPYDWIHDLEQRPGNAVYRFYRFAAGGDLAYNGLQRLPKVIAWHPDRVIVQLGGNDVLALVFPTMARFVRLTKHPPQQPSPEWFRAIMRTIVQRLKRETSARIALCSEIPIGEDPGSSNPFQAAANRRIAEFNAILKDIVFADGVSYIPLYERLQDLLLASPGRAFTSFHLLPFYRDLFRQVVLRKSNDAIGQMNGWQLHRDGIHLNSRSGKILADLVQEFLDTEPGAGSPSQERSDL